jgi:Spy/CpxP family protein refolding chaperone
VRGLRLRTPCLRRGMELSNDALAPGVYQSERGPLSAARTVVPNMRKFLSYAIVTSALVLISAPLEAQQTRPQPGHESRSLRHAHDGPVQRLLDHRAELGLTPEQVTRLEVIDRQMDDANRPLIQQLTQIRRQLPRGRELTAEEREKHRSQLRSAEILLKRIEENNMICMRQVGEILTDNQKSQLRVLLERERRTDGDRDSNRSSGAGGS